MSAGLALFIKACYAAGVTYVAGQKVSKITKESADLYKEWQKFIDKQPPEKKPPTDWEKAGWVAIMGKQAGDAFTRLVDSVKDFFNDFGGGSNKGENRVFDDNPVKYYGRIPYSVDVKKSGQTYNAYVIAFGHEIWVSLVSDAGAGIKKVNIDLDYIEIKPYTAKGNVYGEINLRARLYITYEDPDKKPQYTGYYRKSASPGILLGTINDKMLPEGKEPPKTIEYNYYFEGNTYQFTNKPEDIRTVYPNFENIPSDKFVTNTNPDGSKSTYYKGTVDDLYNDWIKTQNPDNIFGSKPINLVETDKGVKIDDNSEEMPYPNPEPEPEPDTAKGLGEIIALLKQILNWNKNIHDKVGQTPTPNPNPDPTNPNPDPNPDPNPEPEPEPEPEPQPDPLELPNKVELDFSPLQGLTLTDRFPFCLPWDLARAFEKLLASGEPPRWELPLLDEVIIIDFAKFDSFAKISRSFFSLIFVSSLVVVTRRFISGA